jgi:hypothetical protein
VELNRIEQKLEMILIGHQGLKIPPRIIPIPPDEAVDGFNDSSLSD